MKVIFYNAYLFGFEIIFFKSFRITHRLNMNKEIQIFFDKLRERLWFRPLIYCLFSVFIAVIAHFADQATMAELAPEINTESLKDLLDTISASMLVISIFAVASMLSAFSSASSTATPRSFKLIIVDDVSQNALSVFIGAFIFSIVAKIAMFNGLFGRAGHFVLFVITLILFGVVILTFLRWVDRISRLGRLDNTIEKIETASRKAISERLKNPNMQGLPPSNRKNKGKPIYSKDIGYIVWINIGILQNIAEKYNTKIELNCLPGKFMEPNTPIAFMDTESEEDWEEVTEKINQALHIGKNRNFDEDPQFGIIALSEIASRALSPAVNDPGTAIQIIGSFVRLFYQWDTQEAEETIETVTYDRVEVPSLSIKDLFTDAFRPIARDGAGNIEVMLRLQEAFCSLESIDHPDIKKEALSQSKDAYERALQTITFENDLKLLESKSLSERIN